MEEFLKCAATILVAVVMILAVQKQGKEIALVLSVLVCCMVAVVGVRMLEPVMVFIEQLQKLGNLNDGMLEILLKVVGIGLLSEIIMLVCADSGNGALGKALQMLASAVVLWLSLPLLTAMIRLVEKILGEV
jgi:stage III sporulation protein AD